MTVERNRFPLRKGGRYFQERTYEIKPDGKKFLTIMRVDGYMSDMKWSKNKRAALRKGEAFTRDYYNF